MPIAHGCGERDATLEVATAVEAAGFAGLAYTDHPAPSRKWLDGGGHLTFDPFAALSFCAAATSRVRLLTYLAVLPYRNPLLLAKAVATVDRLSAGRLTLVVGTGYLRSEFAALGRSFDDRNALVDESLDVLTSVWTVDRFDHHGRDFQALGVASEPRPVQLPHPPIWIGGNSQKSRARAARCGAGWAPLFAAGTFAATVRTASISSLEDLRAGIVDLRDRTEAAGRDPDAMGVQVDVGDVDDALGDPAAFVGQLRDLGRIGVTDVMLRANRHAEAGRVVESIRRMVPLLARALTAPR